MAQATMIPDEEQAVPADQFGQQLGEPGGPPARDQYYGEPLAARNPRPVGAEAAPSGLGGRFGLDAFNEYRTAQAMWTYVMTDEYADATRRTQTAGVSRPNQLLAAQQNAEKLIEAGRTRETDRLKKAMGNVGLARTFDYQETHGDLTPAQQVARDREDRLAARAGGGGNGNAAALLAARVNFNNARLELMAHDQARKDLMSEQAGYLHTTDTVTKAITEADQQVNRRYDNAQKEYESALKHYNEMAEREVALYNIDTDAGTTQRGQELTNAREFGATMAGKLIDSAKRYISGPQLEVLATLTVELARRKGIYLTVKDIMGASTPMEEPNPDIVGQSLDAQRRYFEMIRQENPRTVQQPQRPEFQRGIPEEALGWAPSQNPELQVSPMTAREILRQGQEFYGETPQGQAYGPQFADYGQTQVMQPEGGPGFADEYGGGENPYAYGEEQGNPYGYPGGEEY